MINGLVSQGIEVITDRTHLVHVSGHPRVDEIEDMIGWVRPEILVPVHGEPLHMAEHAAMARRAGVAKVVFVAMVNCCGLRPAGPEKIDEVPAGRLYKDGVLLVSADERTVADRRRLGFAGMVSIALAVSDRGELLTDPEVTLTGIPQADRQGRKIEDIAYDAALEAFESMPRPRRRDPDAVAEAVRRAARAALGADLEQEAHLPRACSGSMSGLQWGLSRAAGEQDDRTPQPCGDRGARHRRALRTYIARRWAREVSEPIPQPDHGVTTVFITLPNTKIELMEPLGDNSPITKFLDRNPDGGIHHVCYEVDDIRRRARQLEAQGARVLGDGEPKMGAHGKPVLFLHPKDFCGTLIEIEQA